jgi:dipeptidyl aminopeptidase/acylaminoacyl peptidase
MTTPQRLERDLPAILGELALAPYPDYIDDVLSTTAGRGQRPKWAFPERWIPMELTTHRVQGPSMPWRALGALALIAVLIASAIAVYIGTRPRLPDPFGPARNGVVSFERDGTIYLFDPATRITRPLDTDAAGWVDPWFSPDGRSLLVAREVSSTAVEFGVLSVDGGGIDVITPEPLPDADWIEWAPDSAALIATAVRKHARGGINFIEPGVVIIDVASRAITDVPTDLRPSYATFLPPAGERILVVTGEPTHSTFTTMRRDGSDAQELLRTDIGVHVIGRPSLSPDGALLAYSAWHPTEERVTVHVLDIASGADHRLGDDPAIDYTGWPRFAPDGRTVFVERQQDRSGPSETTHLAFIDVATGAVTPTDLAIPDGAATEWSPDGTVVIASVKGADDEMQPHVLVDRLTGRVAPAPWTATSYPSWQRTAP